MLVILRLGFTALLLRSMMYMPAYNMRSNYMRPCHFAGHPQTGLHGFAPPVNDVHGCLWGKWGLTCYRLALNNIRSNYTRPCHFAAHPQTGLHGFAPPVNDVHRLPMGQMGPNVLQACFEQYKKQLHQALSLCCSSSEWASRLCSSGH